MKNMVNCTSFLMLFMLVSTFNLNAQIVSEWNKKNASIWFEKREWIPVSKPNEPVVKYDGFGRTIETASPDINVLPEFHVQLKKLKPHASIDKVEFAKQYHAHKLWWDEAFSFLQETNLVNIKPGKYLINGDNVYATVTEGPSKLDDTTKWESHVNYHDIHYVIDGTEKIGVAPVSSASVINNYDATRDIIFYTTKGKYYTADPGNYFIFFPQDAHRPNLRIEGHEMVKKIVVKIRRENL